MQNSQTQFLVNIVPLTNVVSNVSGLSLLQNIANTVGNLQEMVDYNTKTVYTDYLQSFTDKGSNINVLSPLNLCNVGITSNGTTYGVGSNVGTSESFITFSNTTTATAIGMYVGNNPVFQFSGQGNGLVYDSKKVATEFRVSSMTFVADFAKISSIVVGGTCYAQQFVTLSDERAKSNISLTDMKDISEKLGKIQTYSFRYKGCDQTEFGLLAQEVEEVLPECVKGVFEDKYVNYNSLVAVLLGAIHTLEKRVGILENQMTNTLNL